MSLLGIYWKQMSQLEYFEFFVTDVETCNIDHLRTDCLKRNSIEVEN